MQVFAAAGARQGFVLSRLDFEIVPHLNRWSVQMRASVKYRGRDVVGPFGLLAIDRLDGSVTSFQQRWDHVIETEEPTLSAAQAEALAQAIYAAHVPPEQRRPLDRTQTELCYYPSNPYLGGPGFSTNGTLRVRIAYHFMFGEDQLAVDAITGQSLGGFYERRPRTSGE
jgi:hypothetical protein